MKKFLILICIFCTPIGAEAHPGRTDSNGGHTCHTNCTKWGLEYGQYHYHSKNTKTVPSARTQARQEAGIETRDNY